MKKRRRGNNSATICYCHSHDELQVSNRLGVSFLDLPSIWNLGMRSSRSGSKIFDARVFLATVFEATFNRCCSVYSPIILTDMMKEIIQIVLFLRLPIGSIPLLNSMIHVVEIEWDDWSNMMGKRVEISTRILTARRCRPKRSTVFSIYDVIVKLVLHFFYA